jgi:hypothetical protein
MGYILIPLLCVIRGTWKDVHIQGTLKDELRRALGMGHLPPRELYDRNLEGGLFTGDPEGYAK